MITKENFVRQTSKFFSTGRSTALKNIDSAIGVYHLTPSTSNAEKLAGAIIQWAVRKGLKRNGEINTSRNRNVISTLVSDVAALNGGKACKNLTESVRAAAPAAAANESKTAFDWVSNVKIELDQFKDYACMDAGNFSQCVKHGKQKEVQDRRLAARGKPPMVNVIQSGQYDWKPTALKLRYNEVQRMGKQGECTSFGYLAAYILTKERKSGPRVELVAHAAGRGSHVYILVGRTGGHENGRIPDNWDAVVVDAWAASLGHPCIYKNRRAFVFQGMTKNLKLIMARPEV